MRKTGQRVRVWVLALAALSVLGAATSAGLHPTASSLPSSPVWHLSFSGSTEIPANCTLPSGSPFVSSGSSFVLNASYLGGVEDFCSSHDLTGQGRTVTFLSGYTAAILLAYASNVTIRDFQFAGPGLAIDLDMDTNVTVADDTMVNTGLALALDGSTDVVAASLDANATDGISCVSSSDITVEASYVADSGMSGLTVSDSEGLVVTSSSFAMAQDFGVDLDDDADVTVQSNLVTDEGTVVAVAASGVSELNVSGNNLTGDSDPIDAQSVDAAAYWNNTVSPGTLYPYEISGSYDVTIGDATALDPGSAGVELSDVNGATLRGIDSSLSGYGVEVSGGSDVEISDSNLSNGNTGVYAVDVTGLTVLDSDLAGGNNGLWATGSAGILVAGSNLSRANYPLNLTEGDSNVVVTDSRLDSGQVDGAYLDNVTNVSIEDSSVEWAVDAGVVDYDSNGVSVSGSDLAGNASADGPGAVLAVGGSGLTLARDDLAWTSTPASVTAEQDVTITGCDLDSSSGDALTLANDGSVTVSNDTFVGGTGAGIDATDTTGLTVSQGDFDGIADNGVSVDSSSDVAVESSTFVGLGESAIYVEYTMGFLAANDTLSNDGYAFFLQNDQSVSVVSTTALNGSDGDLAATSLFGLLAVADNFSANPGGDDVTLSLADSSAVALANCTFDDDFEALQLDDSAVTVNGNTFGGDNYSFDISSGSSGLFFHNDFRNDGGWLLPGGSVVAWNDPYPIGGNYWSNYTGTDQFSGPDQNIPGADGIGDTPVHLNGSEYDYYPLMTPWVDHDAVFVESGLSPGTAWSVVLNGTTYSSTTNSIVVYSAVGAFTRFVYSVAAVDGFHPTPLGGTGLLGNGSVVVDITFALPEYPETFSVRGLPANTSWELELDGTSYEDSSQTPLTILLTNGSYSVAVRPIPGYLVVPASYELVVEGIPGNVTFSAAPYLTEVQFVETGLPQGLSWNLAVNGTAGYSSSAIDAFDLPNGSYSFVVNASAGYVPTPASGTFDVVGVSTDLFVHFAQPGSSRSPPPTSGGSSPSSTDYYPYEIAIGVAAGVGAVGWALAALYRRRSGPH